MARPPVVPVDPPPAGVETGQAARRDDGLLEEVTRTREQLRADARATLGIDGVDASQHDLPPLRRTLSDHGLSTYPLLALSLLIVVDQFHGYGFSVLAPEISSALGFGKGTVAAILALKGVAIAISPLPMAAAVQKVPRRALLAIAAGLLWAFGTIGNAFVVTIWGLLAVLMIDGLTSGAAGALHTPLLLDSHPPKARVRALTVYAAANQGGSILSPLLIAALTGLFFFTWRGVFFVMGLLTLAGVLVASRLRDPGFGNFDTKKIREKVHTAHGEAAALDEEDVELGFFEIARRLFLIPTIRRLFYAQAIFGILLIPYQTFLFFFLEERYNIGPTGRGFFFAFIAAVSIVALGLYGRRGEKMFSEDPAKVIDLAAAVIVIAVTCIAIGALATIFWVTAVFLAAASGLLALLAPTINVAILSIIPAQMRPHAAALAQIFLSGVGGTAGAIFLSGIDRRFGITGTIVSLLIPGILGAFVFRSCRRLVNPDLDRMIDEVIEDEEIQRIHAQGGHLPMLACRGIDFSYGQLQVLFDVDFTVDDGEMVALLGVNGAGKSTLLRVVSGLGLPSKGSVRFRGQDITYLDAERRTKLGITQVPGGRAVFGPMSVVENLRLFGYTLGRDGKAIDRAVERSLEAFPRLDERRNQPATTLSGGEQQMLGLSKALMLRPRLLLIDELSLGLAPIIVGQLLDMVREINSDGTAVVLVEQSVNIALSLVDHAYFMEKGEIRFDGRAGDLLGRGDLLRAVFLEGVGQADDPAGVGR
jgi:ABC-type branched-subunit amino acid transport system ATPase component/MFS family permease